MCLSCDIDPISTFRNKVEDVISVGSALELLKLKDHPMEYFESRVWTIYGQCYLHGEELLNRRKVYLFSS